MKTTKIPPSADDNWALVELYRWQYGELPTEGAKPLNIGLGLQGMAKAIKDAGEAGDFSQMPTPFNVMMVLEYMARQNMENTIPQS